MNWNKSVRTGVVLFLAILAQCTGNVILSKAMKTLGSVASLDFAFVARVLENPMLWLGTALLIAFFLLYSSALSWADLSFVLPATSFGYIVNVAFARQFLGEPVSALKWAGTVLIASGVLLVSRTGVRGREASC